MHMFEILEAFAHSIAASMRHPDPMAWAKEVRAHFEDHNPQPVPAEQPPVDNAFVAPGCEQFGASSVPVAVVPVVEAPAPASVAEVAPEPQPTV